MVSERTFWIWLAWTLGVLLAAMVLVNAFATFNVPLQLTAFTTSCLFCIGLGRTIISPKAPPLLLDSKTERKFRWRQLIVGSIISVSLGLLFLLPEMRREPVPWVLMPVIVLTPILIVREAIVHSRQREIERGKPRVDSSTSS